MPAEFRSYSRHGSPQCCVRWKSQGFTTVNCIMPPLSGEGSMQLYWNWWEIFRELGWLERQVFHDDVIKWKHFPHYWPFVRGIHRWQVNSPHKGQWRGALMFSLICAWINGWVNNHEAGDLRCRRAHYDVTVMWWKIFRDSGSLERHFFCVDFLWCV